MRCNIYRVRMEDPSSTLVQTYLSSMVTGTCITAKHDGCAQQHKKDYHDRHMRLLILSKHLSITISSVVGKHKQNVHSSNIESSSARQYAVHGLCENVIDETDSIDLVLCEKDTDIAPFKD